jgi:uncharacterized sodium:solute symporter family permease YidK
VTLLSLLFMTLLNVKYLYLREKSGEDVMENKRFFVWNRFISGLVVVCRLLTQLRKHSYICVTNEEGPLNAL